MNVILESQPGDELICIQGFSASSEGENFSWDTCRNFQIGERVRYVSYRQNSNLQDTPNGWMVIFDAADGKQYAASQTYWVTDECWQGLKSFFAKRLMHEPKRRRASRP